ncbi:MAG TPA: DUF2339 domain-containing protein, partial [Chloroflexota bacterium]|nr:DUF2339 domain-containing protein [Chloroflexota bacterium]
DRVVDEVVQERPQVAAAPVVTPSASVASLPDTVAVPTGGNPLTAEVRGLATAASSAERDRDIAGTPVQPQPPQPPQPSSDAWWSGDLEQLLSGRILAWVGGLAIMVGAVFFLSLAFSRGWIGPGLRVLTGVVASALMIGGGAWFFERRERVFGHVLVAVGLGIMSVSILTATALYDLVPSPVGLTSTLIVALAAALIAVRADSQVVAIFGLVAALAAPPLQDAPVTGTTVAVLAFVLCGTTAIALYRSWSWLPPIAFLLSAPQMAVWIVDDAPITIGLLALSGFWLLNAIAAGGEEYRLRDATRLLRPVSASLLLANVAFLVWGGFTLLDGDAEGGRGVFLVLVALVHAAIAGWFFRTEGDRHPFGLLAAGTSIAAFTIAVPIQLGGPAVPIAWAAEAVALTWVATLRRHPYSAAMATVLGFGAIGYLGLFAYPFWQFGGDDVGKWAFLNASGGTLLFILGALAVAGVISHWRDLRLVLGGVGFALLIYAMPFELSGIALLAGWALLFVLAWTSDQWLERLPGFGDDTRWDQGFEPILRRLLLIPAAISGVLAVLHALVFE